MEQFKKYLRYNNQVYFLLTVGAKAEINTARYVFGLNGPHVVVYPLDGHPIGGKLALYALDKDHLGKQIIKKFDGLNKVAEKFLLKTNVSQIGKRGADYATQDVARKESEAKEAMKKDNKLAEPLPETKKTDKTSSKPDVTWDREDMGHSPMNVLQYMIKKQRTEGKVMNFTKEEEEDRIEGFKKQYLNTSIDVLKALKVLFPDESHTEFVNILKNVKIEPLAHATLK
jgi:hypothetical protein